MSSAQNLISLAAAEASERATNPPKPIPILPELKPAQPFPVECLGEVLTAAAMAIHDKTQAPVAICAQSVLAAATLAAQAHGDVALPTGESAKPLSCLFVTVAESGERKSSVDSFALQPVREFEKDKLERFYRELATYEIAKEAFEAARDRAKRTGGTKTLADITAAIADLGAPPRPPVEPWCLISDTTAEGMVRQLVSGRPSLGLFSDEGGTFLGGHALRDEHRTKTAADLSTLWDGKPFRRTRAADGTTVLYGRRFSAHLMVQPGVAARLFGAEDLRDQGLLSRVLGVAPVTAAGRRLWRASAPASERALANYSRAMGVLLDRDPPTAPDHPQELAPHALALTPEARNVWVAYQHETEKRLGPDGDLAPIRGLANKLPEHAARIAGVFTLFHDINARQISDSWMLGGIELARHYGDEALRLAEASAASPGLARARQLQGWLAEFWPHGAVSVFDICSRGPNAIRKAHLARAAMDVLVEYGHLSSLVGGATIDGHHRRAAWKVIR